MAVTNMSIIEKDDLIKKMPRDSLKEELKNPSGNFPLFLVAARLKEVEEMERDVMARQAAQQSSQDAESVAARLAQQAMPQSPMSAVGANPAPQPRPDPQGIMAQQMAGPTQPLPTVMAQTGLRGKYPGQASEINQEIIAAAARARQARGTPRLYNQARQAGFEKAGRKGAPPASQIPALLGLASALAKTEERAYGGMETLPPFQVESSTMPMSGKGFTAPARSLASRMPKEEDGLSYVSQLLKSMGGSSDDKPTVFAENGFGSQPGMGYDPVLQRDLETFGLSDLQFSRLDPQSQQLIMDSGERYADPSAYERATGIPKVRRDAIRTTLERAQRKNPDSLPFGTGIRSYFAPESEVPRIRAEQDAFETSMAQLRNVLQPPAPPSPPSGSAQAAPSNDAPSVSEGPVVKKLSSPIDPATVERDTSAVPGEKIPDATQSKVTAPGGKPSADVAGSPYDINALLKRLEADTTPAEVGTVSEYLLEAEKLIPDLSPERKKVISDYEGQLASIQKRDPVPKSLTDIRDRMQKRLDDLENSPLPFMTAAAAAIKGNQPILVAMTNAMIGYTAGDEKVKNQGLKIMGELVDTDVKVEGLKAKQLELETTARNAVLKARQEDIQGRDKRARELLTIANNNRTAAQKLSMDNAKLERQRLGQITNLVTGTFKTVEERDRFNTLVDSLMTEEGLSRSDAMIKAYAAPRAGTSSTSAETLRLRYDNTAQKWMEDEYRKLAIRYNASEQGKADPTQTNRAGYDKKVIDWASTRRGALPPNAGVRSAIERIVAAPTGASGTGAVPFSSLTQ